MICLHPETFGQIANMTSSSNKSTGNGTEFNIHTDIVDYEKVLWEKNDHTAVVLIPVMTFLAVLGTIGLVGNSLIFYFYCFKSKKNSGSYFILSLNIFDILLCSFSIPAEIIEMRYFFTFENVPACKIIRTINHFATFASSFVLFSTSLDRYRRICQPFKAQLTVGHAKLVCAICAGLSAFFSVPAAILYTVVKTNVTNSDQIQLSVRDCTTTMDEEYGLFIAIFDAIQLGVSFILLILICIFYCLIAKKIYGAKKFRSAFATSKRKLNANAEQNKSNNYLNGTTGTMLHDESTVAKENVGVNVLDIVERRESVHTKSENENCNKEDIKGEYSNLSNDDIKSENKKCSKEGFKNEYYKDINTQPENCIIKDTKSESRICINKEIKTENKKCSNDAINTENKNCDNKDKTSESKNCNNTLSADKTKDSCGIQEESPCKGDLAEYSDSVNVRRSNSKSPRLTSIWQTTRERIPPPGNRTGDISTSKFTLMMFAITTVFFFSYAPYIVLIMWSHFTDTYEGDFSDASLLWYEFGFRTYFFNSAVNPLIYGYFNPQFQAFFLETFCRCCRKKYC